MGIVVAGRRRVKPQPAMDMDALGGVPSLSWSWVPSPNSIGAESPRGGGIGSWWLEDPSGAWSPIKDAINYLFCMVMEFKSGRSFPVEFGFAIDKVWVSLMILGWL